MRRLAAWFRWSRPTQGGPVGPTPRSHPVGSAPMEVHVDTMRLEEGVRRAAEIDRRGVRVVPDEPSPKPVPESVSPCGFCGHSKDGHGTRYSTFGGAHEWRRTELSYSPLHPMGDPR